MKTYCKKRWLMTEDSNSTTTSSICCFDGYKITDKQGNSVRITSLQINDCRRSIELHTGNFETTTKDFISRLEVLEEEIHSFIEHLKNSPEEI